MRRLPTLSGLGHAIACPASLVLPRIDALPSDAARLGSAIHAWIEREITGAPLELDEIVTRWELDGEDEGRLRYVADHLTLALPAGALAEVALGYWPGGRVDRIAGGAGSYRDEGQLLAGTIDAMWAEPSPLDGGRCAPSSTLWVIDWKTGDDERVPPVGRNWQLRAGALLAARWTGARRVRPAICYVSAAEASAAARTGQRYEGRWEIGEVLDERALADLEADMLRALATLDSGALRTGPQCDWCASRHACPSLAAAAVALARAEGSELADGATLTPEAATRLVDTLTAIRRAADAAEVALRAYVGGAGPVACSDGRSWGPARESTQSYRPERVAAVLAERLGAERAAEVARGATRYTTETLRAAAGPQRGAWPALRRELEAAGAVEERSREVWRRRWVDGQEGGK